jgi:hypothetical protein
MLESRILEAADVVDAFMDLFTIEGFTISER